MKEWLPAPEFDDKQYERPTQNWICGKAAEGQPCSIGPSPAGGRSDLIGDFLCFSD